MNEPHPCGASTGIKQALRFAVTYCSQCGGQFGPGDSGHSTCATHKPVRTRCHAEIDTHVSGIPCGIRVDQLDGQTGDPGNDASDWDHDGWCDIEFTVLDRQGYPAPWLQAKMTAADLARIEGEILASRKEEA